MSKLVWIGYDIAEAAAFEVAEKSLLQHASTNVEVCKLRQVDLRILNIYLRQTINRNGRIWDKISDAPMSTTHAIARFFVPHISPHSGWVLFTDSDVLFRRDVAELFAMGDPSKAIMVVKHNYNPEKAIKKDNAIQTLYPRKNWSSVMLWNTDHPAHEALTLEMLNTVPGRDLHRFCWLKDEEIGELPQEWNWLVNHSPSNIDPALVHFTEGLPDVIGHEDDAYADEWRQYTTSGDWMKVKC